MPPAALACLLAMPWSCLNCCCCCQAVLLLSVKAGQEAWLRCHVAHSTIFSPIPLSDREPHEAAAPAHHRPPRGVYCRKMPSASACHSHMHSTGCVAAPSAVRCANGQHCCSHSYPLLLTCTYPLLPCPLPRAGLPDQHPPGAVHGVRAGRRPVPLCGSTAGAAGG